MSGQMRFVQIGGRVMSGKLQTDDVERPLETEVVAFVKVVDHKLTGWRVVADTAFVDTSGRLWGSLRPNEQRQERFPHPWQTFR